jgi:predicted DNA binding CopG/RHH family protein
VNSEYEKILDLLVCNSVICSEIHEDNKKIIELLEESLNKKDSFYLNESEKKLQMWLSTTKNKIIGNTYRIPESLHEEFKKKCSEEGYSIQEGIARLIKAYVKDNLVITESKE